MCGSLALHVGIAIWLGRDAAPTPSGPGVGNRGSADSLRFALGSPRGRAPLHENEEGAPGSAPEVVAPAPSRATPAPAPDPRPALSSSGRIARPAEAEPTLPDVGAAPPTTDLAHARGGLAQSDAGGDASSTAASAGSDGGSPGDASGDLAGEGAAADGGSPGDEIDYLSELSRQVSRLLARSYPRQARRQGIEGTVVLSLRIDRSGRIERIEVEETSGSSLLDRHAVRTVERAAPFGAVPARMARSELEFDFPLEYTLRDGL